MPPQRWCTRAAPSRRSRTRTRDPLINCTEAARTHARTHASLFERPSILAFRPFRTVTPFLLCFSLPSFHSILVAPLRIRFVSDEIRTFSRHGLRDLLTPRHARAWRIRGDCRGGTVATVVEIRSDSFHRIRRFCTRSTFREPWKLSHFLIVITNTSRRYSGGMLQRVKRARLFHSIRVERRSGFFSFL